MSAPAIVRNSRADYLATNPLGRAAHNVGYHQTCTKRLRHTWSASFELDFEVMDVSADDGLTISVYSAEPGSRSARALDLLASWSAPERAITPADE